MTAESRRKTKIELTRITKEMDKIKFSKKDPPELTIEKADKFSKLSKEAIAIIDADMKSWMESP